MVVTNWKISIITPVRYFTLPVKTYARAYKYCFMVQLNPRGLHYFERFIDIKYSNYCCSKSPDFTPRCHR